MKSNDIEKFMLDLEWDVEKLNVAKEFIKEWDKRAESYYRNVSKITRDFDMRERECYRNCIKFWENRLNENK